MYIWIGCKLPSDFEAGLRGQCMQLNEQFKLDPVAFSLPQHISLKISFNAGSQADAILRYLEELLAAKAPFHVVLEPAQVFGNILWFPVAENEHLSELHTLLDRELENRFGIGQHPFDKGFRFHSTLFFGDDPQKLHAMGDAINALSLPHHLSVNGFLLGVSESGRSGTYRVVNTVSASD